MPFAFPTDVAKLIVARWGHTRFTEGASAAPSLESLIELLNACFFASLKREEGRPTRFTLARCSPTKLEKIPFRFSKYTKCGDLFRFASPRRVTCDELMRLAPACEPEKTLILAEPNNTGEFEVWALVDVGRDTGAGSLALSELQIRVLGPGDLHIILHDHSLCRYKDGQIFESEFAPINAGCVYECFREASFEFVREVRREVGEPVDAFVHERDDRAMAYFRTLRRLIDRFGNTGHGGCLIVVPDSGFAANAAKVAIKYACTDESSAIWNCLKGLWVNEWHRNTLRDSTDSGADCVERMSILELERADIQRGLDDALETLAHFTAVDGAVLVTPRLRLLGFGAVIEVEKTDGSRVFRAEDLNAAQRTVIDVEKYGTRHRSTFQFCYRVPGAVAFVASQDGGVKAVTRFGDDVYYWEEHSFDGSGEIPPWGEESDSGEDF